MVQQAIIQERKPIYCRNEGCEVEIAFTPGMKSKSGKMIPIEKSSGLAHNCKFSPYYHHEPKVNGESTMVTKQPEEDTVFDLLMAINKKMDMILNNFEAMK